MSLTVVNLTLLLPQFAMLFIRVSGLVITAPVLSSMAIPSRLKAAFVLVLTLMLFPVVQPHMPQALTLDVLVVAALGELMIGFVMGLALGMVFVGAQLVGVVIGQQAGISLGRVFNPMMEAQGSIFGQLYSLVTLDIYLAIGGHRAMISAFLDTFELFPPGTVRFSASLPMLDLIEGLLLSAYTFGMQLAAPALIALFIASLVMGFISRTIPQINILSIGFAIRVSIALLVASVSLSTAFEVIQGALFESLDTVRSFFGLGLM